LSQADEAKTALATAEEVVVACPMCGGNRLDSWRDGCADSTGLPGTLTYLECRSCGCRVLTPRVVESSIGEFYGHQYAPYTVSRPSAALVGGGPESDPVQRQLAKTYARADGRVPTVLDFGCGSAAFVDAARDNGWQTVAADFNEEGLRGARASGHEVRLVDESFWPWLAEQQLDVIRMSHVVEHLYDPAERLRDLLAALRPGGTLHVVTPDPDGPGCSLARRHSNFYQYVHVTLIPPRSLERVARDLGAASVTIVPELTTKDLWRSWLLSRRKVTSYEGAPEDPDSRAKALLLRLVVLLASKAGRHDRYHAFVRR
jgi:SAM-dependent methyltransferase